VTRVAPEEPVREQRLVFGEVADAYDRQRPSYPPQLVDAVLEFAGLRNDTTTPVAEVGAGTGKASVLFAARGIRLTCIEPSPAMGAIASRNLADFQNVEVLQTSFEDWDPAPHSCGLLYAAQSWHWIAPQVRYVKSCQVLSPGGSLALFWNVMAGRGGEGLERDLAAAYGDLLPNGMWRMIPDERLEANSQVVEEIEASGLFGPVTIVREPWRAAYDTDSWLELLSTQSDHRMLDGRIRDGLFDRVRRAVDANGGQVEVDYVAVGFLTRPRGEEGEAGRAD